MLLYIYYYYNNISHYTIIYHVVQCKNTSYAIMLFIISNYIMLYYSKL